MDIFEELKDRLRFIEKMIKLKSEMKHQDYEMSALLILEDERLFLRRIIKEYEK